MLTRETEATGTGPCSQKGYEIRMVNGGCGRLAMKIISALSFRGCVKEAAVLAST